MQDSKKSLYSQEEPFSAYMKYLGKPLYKAARRNGASDYISLAAAHVPGAIIHSSPFLLFGQLELAALMFCFSEIILTNRLYSRHRENAFSRARGFASRHQAFQRAREIRKAERNKPARTEKSIEDIVTRLYS
jgi:hypothetical protein